MLSQSMRSMVAAAAPRAARAAAASAAPRWAQRRHATEDPAAPKQAPQDAAQEAVAATPTPPPPPPAPRSRVRMEVLPGGVRKVVLCRGSKLNVMDEAFFADLHAAFAEVDADESARVAVLVAEGKHFTAGLDLKAAAGMFLEDQSTVSKAMFAGAAVLGMNPSGALSEKGMPAMRNQKLHKVILRWQEAITSLQRCRVPTIAAVHGKCIGGGVDLITSADIRIASADATFSIKETEVGIVADLGTLQRIGHIVGQGIARELAFTGMDLGAERAERVGLVNSVHATQAEMEEAAMAMAARIAAMSPLAVQGTKEILNFPIEPEVAAGLRNVALHNSAFLKSNDLLQAVVSFMAKKPAEFSENVIPRSAKHL